MFVKARYSRPTLPKVGVSPSLIVYLPPKFVIILRAGNTVRGWDKTRKMKLLSTIVLTSPTPPPVRVYVRFACI